MHTSVLLITLTLLAFIALIAATYFYKFQGRKEIFNIDFISFVYLFLLTPILFIWMKTFLFYLVKNELFDSISVGELFAIDTAFSVLMLYVVGAVAIHSLTKTFWLRRRDDPEFDVFHLSEYFHLWWSHIASYGGGMVLLTFVSVVNLFIQIPIIVPKWEFWLVPLMGTLLGIIAFITIWLSNPLQKHANFLRIMKLLFAGFFILHAVAYLIFRPSFNATYGIFWFVLSVFLSGGVFSVFAERTKKTDEILSFFKHLGWGHNITLFESRDK